MGRRRGLQFSGGKVSLRSNNMSIWAESSKQGTSNAKALRREHARAFFEQQGGQCGWAD